MRQCLQACADLSQKYVDLSDFKKNSCISIDHMIPEMKLTKDEQVDGPSENRAEMIKINKRKRRRYKNSFLNSKNLIGWTEAELNDSEAHSSIYSGTTFIHFEYREKQHSSYALNNLIKPDMPAYGPGGSNEKNRYPGGNYYNGMQGQNGQYIPGQQYGQSPIGNSNV